MFTVGGAAFTVGGAAFPVGRAQFIVGEAVFTVGGAAFTVGVGTLNFYPTHGPKGQNFCTDNEGCSLMKNK